MIGFTRNSGYKFFLRLVFSLALAAVLTGCGPAVAVEDLPPLAPLDVDGYQPAVAAQLRNARDQVDRKPGNAQANGHLGMLYRTYRDMETAEVLLRRARLLAPRTVDWAYYHGEVLEQRGDYEGAIAAMEQVLEREPHDLPASIHRADMTLQAGDPDSAREQLEQLQKTYPDYSGIFVILGTALEQSGKLEDAVDAWRRALELGGSFGRGHYALAQLYRRLGNTEQADRQLARFNTSDRASPPIHDPRLEKLFALNVSDRPLILRAQSAKARQDYAGALAYLEQAIARNPGNMETRAALVAAYAQAGEYDKAEAHYTAGVLINDTHVELSYSLGRLRQLQGKTDQAMEILTRVTEMAPRHTHARAWLARAQELQGDPAGAGDSYRLALQHDPHNRSARQFYTVWLMEYEDYATAVGELERMATAVSADVTMMYSALAALHDRHGDTQAALVALEHGINAAALYEQSTVLTRMRKQRAALKRKSALE